MLGLLVGMAMITGSLTDDSLRPVYHFTAQKGWLNDPNGLVFYKGEYHLFFQHNPFGTEWGNMTWGHAVSKDLVHWEQLSNALEPDELGTIYSGSALVDQFNKSGFGTRQGPAMVMFYTAAGGNNEASKGKPFTQCMAYSTDGRTFTKFSGNPVIGHIEHENRDPKVFWHQESASFIMALYLDGDRFALFRSPDLKKWTRSGDVTMPGSSECPDLFELPFGKKSYWVFTDASGHYRLGNFDGYKFTPLTEPIEGDRGANSYAAQTYSDLPKGRRVQISWMRDGRYPGQPFNQQMTIPRELTLRATPSGPRLSLLPVKELEKLRKRRVTPAEAKGDALEIRATFSRDQNASLSLGPAEITYDAATKTVTCLGRSAKVLSSDLKVDLIVYLDKTSVEVFADHGLISMPFCFVPKATPAVSAKGFEKIDVFELGL